MTEVGAIVSSLGIVPIDQSQLIEYALPTLQLILQEGEAKLDAKILERNRKTAQVKLLSKEYVETTGHARRGPSFGGMPEHVMDVTARCQLASREQHALNLEIDKMHAALLPIREAIVAKKHPTP